MSPSIGRCYVLLHRFEYMLLTAMENAENGDLEQDMQVISSS